MLHIWPSSFVRGIIHINGISRSLKSYPVQRCSLENILILMCTLLYNILVTGGSVKNDHVSLHVRSVVGIPHWQIITYLTITKIG